jgi:hypothetical protein
MPAFVVRGHGGQKLAYVYFEEEPARRSAAKLPSLDEARRIARISLNCPNCCGNRLGWAAARTFLLITSEVMRPRFLNKDEFVQVVRNAPLVSIDLIIRNPDQCVLVGLRTNEPPRGKWFVPGGVVRKYERLAVAFARIVKAEL